ncbi:MAG: hypothetical protein KTM48_00220, partial [Wolbachia endosymbiont of Pissodes strobi]|nr:hypothetical protein [Wolbachia endosymbiont of Pissodes strobi]
MWRQLRRRRQRQLRVYKSSFTVFKVFIHRLEFKPPCYIRDNSIISLVFFWKSELFLDFFFWIRSCAESHDVCVCVCVCVCV